MKQPTKKYIKCTITMKDGTSFPNPLKLGEVVLLSQILRDAKKVEMEIAECTPEQYKAMFG